MGKRTTARVTAALGTWTEPEQVHARGRALRSVAEFADHQAVSLASGRPSVLEFMLASNAGRLPELIPLRVGRMLASPFAFFRGAAGLMAGDLAAGASTGVTAQLCVDAHAANFGLYGTLDGQIVMDINDFDETLPGPWEWDLKRLVTSLVKTDDLVDDFAKAAAKSRKNTSARFAAKWTEHDGERWRFITDPPTFTTVPDDTATAVTDSLPSYVDTLRDSRRNLIMRYSVSDVAFRVAGTGSVGLRNYLILLHGNGHEALVLQAKEARRSALAPHLDVPPAKHEGNASCTAHAWYRPRRTSCSAGRPSRTATSSCGSSATARARSTRPPSNAKTSTTTAGWPAPCWPAHARSVDPRLLGRLPHRGRRTRRDVHEVRHHLRRPDRSRPR